MNTKPRTEKIIDLELSLKRANNKPDLAEELLGLLIQDLQETQKKILDAWEVKDWPQLLHQAHKLNGATCYCGVPRLQIAAATLENELKIKNSPKIKQLVKNLDAEISALFAAYKQNLFTKKP